MKKKFKKVLKIILWIISSIFGLILLLILALQIPFVQNKVKDKAVRYLESKIHTEVRVGTIEIGLPKKVILTDFYFEDQSGDTLLSGKKLDVDVSLFKLLSNTLEVNHVYMDGITAKINKNKDSVFNFDYIIQAFASKEPNTTSEPMEIDVNKVKISNTRFYYDDAINKNDLATSITYFETEIDAFDLEKLALDIPKIQLDGLKLELNQGVSEAIEKATDKIKKETQNQTIKLQLKDIALSKIAIKYKDENTQLDTQLQFQKLNTKVKEFDLNQQKIALHDLQLEDTYGKLSLNLADNKVSSSNSSTPSKGWELSANKVTFKNVNVDYDNTAVKKSSYGLDTNHLSIKKLNWEATDLVYTTNIIKGTINNLSFIESNDFEVTKLSTQFEYASQNAFLKNLVLVTPNTNLDKETLLLKYPSIASLSKNPESIEVQANFTNSKIGFKDILFLVPDLADQVPFNTNKNSIVNLTAQVSGKLNNLKIKKVQASGIGSTSIDMNGVITGLPNTKATYLDIKINALVSTAQDVNTFLPKNTIPNSITLPENFEATGNFIGYLDNFTTHIDLKSSFGNAVVDATLNQKEVHQEQYTLNASLTQFDIGKLIQNDKLGKVSVKTIINGKSLDPKTMNTNADVTVISADYNAYNYKNLILNGEIQNGHFVVTTKSNDPNITFQLESKGDFDGKYPKAQLHLNLDLIDLNKLNLHAGPLKMKGNITADFETLDVNHLNGSLMATNFLVALENEQFPLDTIYLKSVATETQDSILLKSQFVNVNLNGNYELASLPTAVSQSFNHYFNSTSSSGSKAPNPPQHVNFDIYIKEEEILKKIVPDLEETSAIHINGNYNSANDSIRIKGTIPHVKYANNEINGVTISVDKEEKALVYDVEIGKLKNSDIIVPKTQVSGKVEHNQLDYQLRISDNKDVEKYNFAGNYKQTDTNSTIQIDAEKLVLNYENWNIDSKNTIIINKNGINIQDFILNHNQNNLKIQSETESFESPIQIDLKDFELKSITNIVTSNYEFGGRVNGFTTIENLHKTPVFVADITIDDASFKKDTIGTIALKIDNKIANTYTANINLSGQNNQAAIQGDYQIGTGNLDFKVALEKLQMKSIQPFTSGNLTESDGYLNGNLTITGQANNPEIQGQIKFNNVGFVVAPLNSKFKLINDAIDFNNQTITFNTFRFKDENENDLEINGTVNSANYANLGFDLKIKADNFRAVNSEAKDSDLFYGKLYLDNNLILKGDFESPIIEGNIKINKDTEFTIVLPQEDPSIADREGIVKFVDEDQPVLITVKDPTKAITETDIKGMNASVNIEIDKDAEISIIIDKANGDFLKLKGEAELNGGIDPSGKTTLTGKYEFTSGSYEMNFNLIKRKFDIKPGSYIVWTGEPTSANVNVTAIYKTDIAPIDLVNDQLGEVTAGVRNTYKQKIPFETQLKMTGELMKPEIHFDIVLPEENNDVSAEVINTTQAKLEQIRQQEDVLNKQVFAVLLLNRFIGENPFQSETGGISASYLAKQSASRILSEQLNQIAGDLIQGFQIDFDLQATEDYTSGQKQNRTDLNVGISKELVDDRLKISVGSSFGIEGTQNENEQANNIAGDLTAEYLITKDGRYKLKAYRKNNYQVALQGQVIETGVAFIITMNYDKFKELFQKNKDKKNE